MKYVTWIIKPNKESIVVSLPAMKTNDIICKLPTIIVTTVNLIVKSYREGEILASILVVILSCLS